MAKGKQRDRQREARWRQILDEQRRSGSTVRAYCRANDIRETAFHYWRRELRRRQGEQEQRCSEQPLAAPMFVPVHLNGHDAPSGTIEILFPTGCRVHVMAPVDRQTLADVLAALHDAAGCEAQEARGC